MPDFSCPARVPAVCLASLLWLAHSAHDEQDIQHGLSLKEVPMTKRNNDKPEALPPNCELAFLNGVLRMEPAPTRGQRLPTASFFRSLACRV